MAIQNVVKNPKVGLLKVDYKVIKIPEDDSSFSISVNDHFDCKIVNEGAEVAALFHRSVTLNPPQLFSIDVIYEIDWEIDADKKQELATVMKNLDLADKNFLCYSAQAEAAMLIAQMTQSNSMLPPLWTPNNIIEETEDR